jgi:chemotaxis protein methyltransferase CheR
MNSAQEFKFTREDFDYLRNLVTQSTGIIAGDEKYTMFYARLARRVRSLGLKDFAEYCALIEQKPESELIELVNSVTTNLTAFFRENHHFEFLKDTVCADFKKSSRTRKLRIWSAGCSTGEEAYSIAIALAEALPDYASRDIRIYATDLDSNVINTGRAGVYDEARVEKLDSVLLKQYFERGVGKNQGKVRVKAALRKMVHFQQLNLLHSWPWQDKMDCIFCRNVVIYFDKATKLSLVEKFARHMVDGGYLFMGHSESLYRGTETFQLLGRTIYRKL